MTGCGGIRSQFICDELVWDKAIFLQQLTHEFQRGTLVPFRLDQNIEDLALSIDGAPKIDHAAIDFQIESSGPGELHPQALTDPDVSVSTHPAPTVQPLPGIAVSNVQKVLAPDA